MNDKFLCPICNTEATPLYDEVDIGVGTQINLYGCECSKCGQVARCQMCGGWDKHAEWCSLFNVEYIK